MSHSSRREGRRPLRTAALAAALALAAGCAEKPPAPPMAFPPAKVTTTQAVARDVPVYLDEIGRCVSGEVVSVQAQVSGPVSDVLFEDGQEVKKGAPLFRIDARPYQAKLDQAEAQLGQDKAQLELRRLEYKRIEQLRGSNAVSVEDIDARKSAVDVAEAQIKADEAMVSMARVDLERTSIASPVDGRAGRKLVDAGNVVSPADRTPMLVIRRMDPIQVELTIPETELGRVRESLAAGVMPVEVRVPGAESVTRTGALTFVDNSVDETTGTVKLRATIANPERALWPGQFVKVRLILGVIKDGVLVPARSVGVSQQGPYVYVLKEDSTVELRPVVRSQEHGDLMLLEKGIVKGERVVTGGLTMLFPGAKVQPVDEGGAK